MDQPRIPDEKKPFDISNMFLGLILIVIAVFIYLFLSLSDSQAYKIIKAVICAILVLAGIYLFLKNTRSMDYYYLDGNSCKLNPSYRCRGGCKKCIFAMVYLENEIIKEKDDKKE